MDEKAFGTAMMDLYKRTLKETGYPSRRFLAPLHDVRGMETARTLINDEPPGDGFTAMWEKLRLDLTVENLVLQPEWQPLFSQEPSLLKKAHERLLKYGYQPPEISN